MQGGHARATRVSDYHHFNWLIYKAALDKQNNLEEQNMELLTYEQLTTDNRLNAVKSQKAAAIFDYVKYYDSWSIERNWQSPKAVPLLLDDLTIHTKSAGDIMGFPCFLRTCPETPRHGVLESVRCDDEASLVSEFERLRDIMLEEDPNGCLMLMPFVSATNSSVVALSHDDFQGYTVFGTGHDGVTAGHGRQIGFPLRADINDSRTLNAMSRSPASHELEFVFKVDDKRDRGLSALASASETWITQIRGCPEHTPVFPPPEGVDTIGMVASGEVTIKDSITMTGLEEVAWLEENITKDNCPDGFFVVEPNGNRLSHIYAHCRGVGVPYAIVPSVTVGDRWVEAAPGWVVLDNDHKFEPKPYAPLAFIDDFMRGLESGNLHWRKQHGWLATFFHQWVSLPYSKPQDVAFLAGHFTAWLSKAITALGLGEMRHGRDKKRNMLGAYFAAIDACVGENVWVEVKQGPGLPVNDRKHYYAAIGQLKLDWADNAKMQNLLAQQFKGSWSAGFGGPDKWGESMLMGASLSTAIQAFINEPDEETLGALIVATNAAENCVHNNGSLFNKFLDKRAFDVGTAGFDPNSNLGNASAVYEMACSLLEPSEEVINSAASAPVNNWSRILDYFRPMTPAKMRANPVSQDNNAPEILRTTINNMATMWRHGDKGEFNNPKSEKFIMCGYDGCATCATFVNWASSNPEIHASALPQLHKTFINPEHIAMVITPSELDVWIAGTEEEVRLSTKQQIYQVKAKTFMPTPAEFTKLYGSMMKATLDPDYPEMAMILSKYLSKQDDTKVFLEQMSEKKEVDVNEE
tara:strand:- start:6861 stop:9281 length:2421 start_codon:yes stop_codon:yes gene_type:complete